MSHLTPEEALKLEAGRELNEWIARNVLRVIPYQLWSRHIERAFEVEAKLFERGWHCMICRANDGTWEVGFSHARFDGGRGFEDAMTGYAPTLPLAICRAAVQVLIYESQHSTQPENKKQGDVL